MEIEIKFKKTHPDAILPAKNHNTDAGIDLYAVEDRAIPGLHMGVKTDTVVPVGLELAYLTPGYFIQVACRSGLGFKHGLSVHNGIVDNEYRGDLGILLRNFSYHNYEIKKGDRIAQLIVLPSYIVNINWGETETSDRGSKGFGSSGK